MTGDINDLPSAPAASDGVERVRPTTLSRMRAGVAPAIGAIVVLVIVGAAALAVATPSGPASPSVAGPAESSGQRLVGCFGQGPGFSPSALTSGANHAEMSEGGAAATLRALIAAPAWGDGLPASGWTIVSRSDSMEIFVAPVASDRFVGGYVEVTAVPGSPAPGGIGADGWQAYSWGSCSLMAVAPAGYGSATWTLDPAVPFSAGTTELHVLVTEFGCHGEASAEGRILPNVEYSSGAVVVTLATLSREGAQTCPGTPPTPYVLRLDEPVGSRALEDGGVWPALSVAVNGAAVVSPSPTPEPSNWHQPIDCTGEAEGPGSFKAASMSANFDVYCATLPNAWQRKSMSDYDPVMNTITVTYAGPNGETLTLSEGDLCKSGPSACATVGAAAGTAMFGDREGQVFAGPALGDYSLYVDPGKSPSWSVTGKGMSLETFKALAAALIVVAK